MSAAQPETNPAREAVLRSGDEGIALLLSGDPSGGRLICCALEGVPPGPARALLIAALALRWARSDVATGALQQARSGADEPEQGCPPTSRCEARVRVACDGTTFWRPDGECMTLHHRQVLRRLLAALARALCERPGIALSRPELIREVWPDERKPGCPSAVNRLHVSLSALRHIGLGGVLCSTKRGWLLSPERVLLV